MPLQARVPGDAKRPNGVVKYVPTVGKDDDLPDPYQLGAIFLGMAALLLKAKWASWTSILCILCSLATYNTRTDLKQLASSVMFVVFGTASVYLTAAEKKASPY